jgi:hypothetical protein
MALFCDWVGVKIRLKLVHSHCGHSELWGGPGLATCPLLFPRPLSAGRFRTSYSKALRRSSARRPLPLPLLPLPLLPSPPPH